MHTCDLGSRNKLNSKHEARLRVQLQIEELMMASMMEKLCEETFCKRDAGRKNVQEIAAFLQSEVSMAP